MSSNMLELTQSLRIIEDLLGLRFPGTLDIHAMYCESLESKSG